MQRMERKWVVAILSIVLVSNDVVQSAENRPKALEAKQLDYNDNRDYALKGKIGKAIGTAIGFAIPCLVLSAKMYVSDNQSTVDEDLGTFLGIFCGMIIGNIGGGHLGEAYAIYFSKIKTQERTYNNLVRLNNNSIGLFENIKNFNLYNGREEDIKNLRQNVLSMNHYIVGLKEGLEDLNDKELRENIAIFYNFCK